MPSLIPLTNDGKRTAQYELGGKIYILESYYLPKTKSWLLDIYDINENPILLGIKLIPGIDNLVKGKTIEFDDQGLQIQTIDGGENNTPDSLGTTAFLIYYAKGETIPQSFKDKMLWMTMERN